MDLSFSRRNRKGAAQAAALIDYHRLIAGVAAAQAGSQTAALEARLSRQTTTPETPAEALVALFDPGAEVLDASAALGGSFHPGVGTRPLAPQR
jgi:hypothetical protein